MKSERKEFRRSGFTLIEMLVVIAIIGILMGAIVAIGSSVRANASRRSTLAELKTLEGLMKDYLAAGNPEPTVPTAPSSPNGWFYGALSDSPNYRGDTSFNRTSPGSDPFNWVIALKSSPEFSKKLDSLPNSTDANVSSMFTTPVIHPLIMDSYGTHIRYVPYDATTKKEGYFMSAGPDGQWSTRLSNTSSPSANLAVLRADEIYSYDPQ